MIREVAPQIVDAATEIIKDSIRTYLGHHSSRRIQIDDVPTSRAGADDECPYCIINRHLCYAHRLLVEVKRRPDLTEIMCEAAGIEISEAVRIDHRIAPSADNERLAHNLRKIELIMLRALQHHEIDQIAAELWALSGVFLDLALVVQRQDRK